MRSGVNAWWRNRTLWVAIGLVALTALYAITVSSFSRTAIAKTTTFPPAAGANLGGLRLEATMLTVDPVLNSYTMRLNFTPSGEFAGTTRNTLAKPVRLAIDSVSGDTAQTYAPGQIIPITDVTLDALGQTDNYPFDKHTFSLHVTALDAAGHPVPVSVAFRAAVDDWFLVANLDPHAPPDEMILNVAANRSASVLIMALGLMVILIMLVIVNVFMVIRAIRLHKVEFTTLAALGATLFAIPGIRNGMPAAPPVGTLADFLVFFWALMIIGLCLVAAATSWFRAATAELKARSKAAAATTPTTTQPPDKS
jgi:hypothetical protein